MKTLSLRDAHAPSRDPRTVFKLFEQLRGGLLKVRLPDGSCALFGEGDHAASLNVQDEAVFTRVLARGDIGLAESYLDGQWDSPMEYLRVVGGTNWQWSGSALRLRPEDFGMYSRFRHGVDWPIAYDQLETDYAEEEKELGVSGDPAADTGLPRPTPFPLPPVPPSYAEKCVAERLHGAGLSFTARPVARNTLPFDGRSQCAGFGPCSPICPTGAHYSAMVHEEKAQHLGVRVLENCPVERLHADTLGKIRSVAFTRSDGSTGTAQGALFAIAANALKPRACC